MKKNILVILCDQLRADLLSCYGCGSFKTPAIDELAEHGTLFRGAVTASPVCAPARASMMTGRYVSDHQVWTNDVPFREGMELLPERMSEMGYRTGCFGKLHHFPPRDTKGFDTAFLMEENRMGKDEDYLAWLHEKQREAEDVFPEAGGNFPYGRSMYYENWIADRAMDFMIPVEEKPFFSWISFQGPHTPLDPPEEDELNYIDKEELPYDFHEEFDPPCEVAKYRKYRLDYHYSIEDHRNYRFKYCKLIREIDHQVGRILGFLKKNGIYEDTIIIFSADHGDLCGDYGMRQKGPFLYKGQLEIPFIIANHPNLPKGTATDMPVGNLDIGATVLGAAGSERPFGQSRDIGAMYQREELRHKVIFSELCDSVKIISSPQYRLAYYPFTGECELINRNNERINLANDPAYQDVLVRMLMHVIDFMVCAKGVRIEAQDLTPKVQHGLREKMPDFKNDIPLAFPIQNACQIENLKRAGLNYTYNEFCKTRGVLRSYGTYWDAHK